MDLNKKIEQFRRQAEQSDLLKTASASAKKVADEAKKQAVRAVESDTFKDAAGKGTFCRWTARNATCATF